jgi:hypothetical protein
MKSQWHKVTSGIPKGSVLARTSIIQVVNFISDLPECLKSDVFLFADDTNIFREIKDDSDASFIQSDLNELFKWSTFSSVVTIFSLCIYFLHTVYFD